MGVKLVYGMELECAVNDELGVEIGDYHDGVPFGRYWVAENDGSLDSDDGFDTVEFVSHVYDKAGSLRAIDDIHKKIDDGDEFENIDINSSCGAHIHFSAEVNGKVLQLFRTIPLRFLESIRDKTMKGVESKYPEVYDRFSRHYFRDFSKKHDDYIPMGDERYSEFNFTKGKGAEWRSFNLLGVNKWSELRGMYEVAFNALEDVVARELEKDEPFVSEVDFCGYPYKGRMTSKKNFTLAQVDGLNLSKDFMLKEKPYTKIEKEFVLKSL